VARVLVLGGTGFVGPFVVQQLVARGDDVTLFHRGRHEPPLVSGARHVHGDFDRLAEHVQELAGRKPEVVVDVSPGIGKCGHGVLHFAGIAPRGVVLTSMDVYRAMAVLWEADGRRQAMPVDETSELRDGPSPDLTADLQFDNLEVEQAVRGRRADFPVTVLRCPVIYGPLDSQRRLRSYVRRMEDGRPAIVLDSRLARLRLSRGYVENVAAAAVAATHRHRSAGRTYNVGEPDALSEGEWVRAVGDAFGWKGAVVSVEPDKLPDELRAPLPDQDLFADTSRIRKELGFAEPVDRNEGLRRAVAWERSQAGDDLRPDYAAEDAVLLAMGLA
jgi:nucleoside-diphosphate-sugar epimerase